MKAPHMRILSRDPTLAATCTPSPLPLPPAPSCPSCPTSPPAPPSRSDFIFPLRLRGGKPTPVIVWLMAAVFCVYNGWMQVGMLLSLFLFSAGFLGGFFFSPNVCVGRVRWVGWQIPVVAHLRRACAALHDRTCQAPWPARRPSTF